MRETPVKTVVVTQSDPFFTGSFLRTFVEHAGRDGVEPVEVVLLPNFNESRVALARRVVSLYGPIDFARLLWRYMRAKASDRFGAPCSVEAIASRHGIPVRRLVTINDDDYLRSLAERGIDVLLSVAAPEIFREAALHATPHALNVHSGKLPAYRGMMPTFWALLDGHTEIVLTVHEMAERVDAGGIIAELPLQAEPGESAFDVARRAKLLAGREVSRLLSLIGTEGWPGTRPVDADSGTYHGFPTRRDARALRAAGRPML